MYWEDCLYKFNERDGGAMYVREGQGPDRHDYYVAGVFYDYIDGTPQYWATIIAYDNGNVIGEGYITVDSEDTAADAFWYGDGGGAENEDLGVYGNMEDAKAAVEEAIQRD